METRKMKNAFVKTKNVKNFVSLMDSLQKLPPNIPKLALVYGEHGLGKTHSIIWWATRNDAVYVRANNEMTQAALMRAIVDELGERPLFMMQDNYNIILNKNEFIGIVLFWETESFIFIKILVFHDILLGYQEVLQRQKYRFYHFH